ncbi:hypothetical protein KBB89_02220 [Candidatus Gracilibacteria bacterium]|nr:hypothetical protein [Candidatus Gracilibacteria bacterium]
MNIEVSLPERPKNGKLFDFYFKTREFEADGKLYERLGIKHFQKIVMSTVGKVFRILGDDKKPDNYFIGKTINESSLRKYISFNKVNETIHAMGTPFCILGIVRDGNSGDYGNFPLYAGVLMLNFYCIMFQRYNRARVENILSKRYKEKA